MSSEALASLGPLARFIAHHNLTKVQERVIPSLMANDDNAVIAAPTGSGKTLLLEVAMLKLFRRALLGEGPRSAVKAVYICPMKALAYEKYAHWKSLFAPLTVVIETGEQEHDGERQSGLGVAGGGAGTDGDEQLPGVASADVIVTTPERWDSLTRRWKERAVLALVNAVGLLLLDEVHTVSEDRGAALEAVVSRMMAITSQRAATAARAALGEDGTPPALPTLRLVATSGTLPNMEDIAEWLHVPPAMAFAFSAEDRPVPLTIRVMGFPSSSANPFALDRFLSFKLFPLIRQYSRGRPTIIFCASRKEAAGSAQRLVTDLRAQADGSDLEPSPEVLAMANTAHDKHLRQCLLLGIAFHHAALAPSDRALVERMFREQYIAAVCTTTTLALGVNLPAHLVIVKGTTFFKGGKRDDVPLSEVAQMCGRAGRPGLDDHGVALVLTSEDRVRMYENLTRGNVFTTVESQLHRGMIEHVNAEVALRTIHSFASAMDWIRTTFFWIRLRRCPRYYGLSFASAADEASFRPELFAERLMQRVLTALYEEECIDIRRRGPAEQGLGCVDGGAGGVADHEDGDGQRNDDPLHILTDSARASVESTRVGRNMARLYILFDTVKTVNDEVRSRLTPAVGALPLIQEPPAQANAPLAPTDLPEASDRAGAGTKDASDAGESARSQVAPRPRRLFPHGAAPLELQRRFRLPDVLALLCHSSELAEVGLRQGDKGPLNEMNKLVKFPIKSGHKGAREVRERWHKAYVLVQGQLAQLPVMEVSLRNDLTRLWAAVPRVCRFLSEYARFTGAYTFHLYADLLQRCIARRLWPDGSTLRQLDGVNDAVARALAKGGYRGWRSVCAADPQRLEALCGRLPPFGVALQRAAAEVPRARLSLTLLAVDATGGRRFRVSVSAPDGDGGRPVMGGKGLPVGEDVGGRPCRPRRMAGGAGLVLVAGDTRHDRVLLHRYLAGGEAALVEARSGALSVIATFEFTAPPGATSVEVALIVERWVGADVTLLLRDDGGARRVGDLVTSEDSEHGSLSNATALTGSHALSLFAPPGPTIGVDKSEAGESAGKERTNRKKTPESVVAVEEVVVDPGEVAVSGPTSGAREREEAVDPARALAETARQARDAFTEMMEDLSFIHGEATSRRRRATDAGTPSARGRSDGKTARVCEASSSAPPPPPPSGRVRDPSVAAQGETMPHSPELARACVVDAAEMTPAAERSRKRARTSDGAMPVHGDGDMRVAAQRLTSPAKRPAGDPVAVLRHSVAESTQSVEAAATATAASASVSAAVGDPLFTDPTLPRKGAVAPVTRAAAHPAHVVRLRLPPSPEPRPAAAVAVLSHGDPPQPTCAQPRGGGELVVALSGRACETGREGSNGGFRPRRDAWCEPAGATLLPPTYPAHAELRSGWHGWTEAGPRQPRPDVGVRPQSNRFHFGLRVAGRGEPQTGVAVDRPRARVSRGSLVYAPPREPYPPPPTPSDGWSGWLSRGGEDDHGPPSPPSDYMRGVCPWGTDGGAWSASALYDAVPGRAVGWETSWCRPPSRPLTRSQPYASHAAFFQDMREDPPRALPAARASPQLYNQIAQGMYVASPGQAPSQYMRQVPMYPASRYAHEQLPRSGSTAYGAVPRPQPSLYPSSWW